MKNYILNAALITALMTGLSACTDNDYMELDKGSEPLSISVSETAVTLEENAHSSDAFEIRWTTGTNFGTGNRISYTLELAQAGSGFENSVIIKNNEVQTYNWKPSVEQLNSILLDELHARPGEEIGVNVMVTASVSGMEGEVQTSECSFSAVPYEPVTETLYLIGDATPNGLSADHPTEMQRVDNGVFSWTGNMKEGNFKFITTAGQFLPSYNDNGNGGLVYRDDEAQPDLQFSISEAHAYKIEVNLLNLSITVQQVEGVTAPYDNIFFVGDNTNWGFQLMDRDPLDMFLFRAGIFFTTAGQFKFGTSDGSWENMYKATSENAPYTSEGVEFVKEFDPDNKWYIDDSQINQAYKICLDIRPGKERMIMRQFTPYQNMYLIGSAAPGGWDLGQGTPMTVDTGNPNIFTWTGHLNEGELKFSADLQSDWNGAWFMASSENATPTGTVEKTIFIDKSDTSLAAQYPEIAIGDVDYKWVINEAGNYTITLNQLLEEITIIKN